MALQGALAVLDDSERHRHPGSLAIQAYFDGWSQAAGGPAYTYPRFLTRDEEESWRNGWQEAKAEGATYGEPRDTRPALQLLVTPRPECAQCPITAVAA